MTYMSAKAAGQRVGSRCSGTSPSSASSAGVLRQGRLRVVRRVVFTPTPVLTHRKKALAVRVVATQSGRESPGTQAIRDVGSQLLRQASKAARGPVVVAGEHRERRPLPADERIARQNKVHSGISDVPGNVCEISLGWWGAAVGSMCMCGQLALPTLPGSRGGLIRHAALVCGEYIIIS
jgi:hypothetical protein